MNVQVLLGFTCTHDSKLPENGNDSAMYKMEGQYEDISTPCQNQEDQPTIKLWLAANFLLARTVWILSMRIAADWQVAGPLPISVSCEKGSSA